jgi:RluA family pseudouridine synthase
MTQPPPPPSEGEARREIVVPASSRGARVDRFLAERFPAPRRRIAELVRAGRVRVDDRVVAPGASLGGGERIEVPPEIDVPSRRPVADARGPRPVEVVHRDDDLLVVVKPPGVPCHGGAGLGVRRTLLERLKDEVMAGFNLVNRIDQDTSGLVVLARGDLRAALSEAFAEGGAVEKTYDALVEGVPDPAAGRIDLPLADPGHGTRARVDQGGKPATTEYAVVEDFGRAARVRITPRTGRTHQIRVHLAAIGTPLLVDPLYGARSGWRLVDPKGGPAARLARTPLHASDLTFVDPRTQAPRTFHAALLDDHRRALEVLRVVGARDARRARTVNDDEASRSSP